MFVIIAITRYNPNSQTKNFGNWAFWKGIYPLYIPFVYAPFEAVMVGMTKYFGRENQNDGPTN